MDSKTIDFYLEELTESAWNTNLIKNKREIHANVCFHIRKNSTQLFYEYRMENTMTVFNPPTLNQTLNLNKN